MPQARQERLHPDHQRRVYIYPARIISAPVWLEEQASLYGECWNALADALHSALLPIWREENARRAGIETLPEDERRDAYRALDREIRPRKQEAVKPLKNNSYLRAITGQFKGRLSSDIYTQTVAVLFATALSEWPARRKRAAESGAVKWETGRPRRRRDGDDSCVLPYIFNLPAGKEVRFDDLYADDHAVRFQAVPDEITGANCSFRLKTPQGQDAFKPVLLRVTLHRLPPSDAIVKRVTLLRRDGQWKLSILVEEAPRERIHTGRMAGWNSIGWRRFDDRIRVGVVADNAGHFYELSVPLLAASRERRREARFVTQTLGREYAKGQTWLDLADMDSKIGLRLEACKTALRAAFAREGDMWPDEARRMMAGIVKIRDAGLKRLLSLLSGHHTESELILREWLADGFLLRQARNTFCKKAVRARNDAWNKIAAWLSRSFDRICQTDGELKELAEADDQPHALKASQYRRQIVGQHVLRQRVKESCEKRGAELITTKDTWTCECGAAVSDRRKVVCVCANGHFRDQDVSASIFALKQLQGVAGIAAAPLEIPPDLTRYVRVMSASEAAIQVTARQ